MSIPTITVNGTFRNAAGDPMTGNLSFRLNAPLVDSVGNVVSERVEIVSTLNASGQITDTNGTTVGLVLYCTSGGDIAPDGLLYDVQVNVGSRPHKVSIAVPSSLGSSVDFADLIPVPSTTGVVWTVPDLTPEQGRDLIGSTLVGGTGVVVTVDDPGDTVTLSAGWAAADATEAAARIAGDAAEATARAAAVTAEATARAAADTADAAAWAAAIAGLSGTYLHGVARTAVKTSAYTAAAGDLVPVDTTSGAVTITLPNAPADKTLVVVKHVIQGGTNTVTVNCAGSDVFNKTGGATTATLTLLAQALVLEYTATGGIWTVLADDLPLSALDARFQPLAARLTTLAGRTDTTEAAALRTAALDAVYLTASAVVPAATGVAATDTANVLAAIAAAEAVGGTLFFPPNNNWSINQTLVILNCDVEASVSSLLTFDSAVTVGIDLGSASTYLRYRNIKLPKIGSTTSATLGGSGVPPAGSIGVRAKAMNDCKIWLPFVGDFDDGIALSGDTKGVSYNTFFCGQIYSYTRNVVFAPVNSGWSNQNTFIDGRFGFTRTGTAVSGVRQVQLGLSTTANPVETNTFVGCSFEADIPQYHIECSGYDNQFINCRFEDTSLFARVHWMNGPSSTGAKRNKIDGGFVANSAGLVWTVTTDSNAKANRIIRPREWVAVASLLNSWANSGGSYAAASYRLSDQGNAVELSGGIKTGTSGTVAFNLPAGYRPLTNQTAAIGNASSGGVSLVVVTTAGDVSIFGGSTTDTRQLNCRIPIDI